MTSKTSILEKLSSDIGYVLSGQQIEQFNDFYKMLVEKNKVMNLTAITEYDEVVLKHFIDSIVINKRISDDNVKSIMDVGTGAGFPGIPLKILFPEIKLTLLDSLNKRILFLNEVIYNLGLDNIECVHGRAEDVGHLLEFREQYDLTVSRAVANLSSLSEYCIPFVRVGGKFISYKSGVIDEELSSAKTAIQLLGSEIEEVEKYTLPDSDIQRSLVVIRKEKKLSKKYPRKAGIPGKQPL
ncbi:MAG: 16S rRNA (guanine(527)-N(7))-methyltransferase RsmG [Lachnospiraceae bacterium]|nr:16S rRNA (guanine(527)-N(7))-methyltransferase RsmG [Lachnospiraceae bacterium]